jgi:hypothetical protein
MGWRILLVNFIPRLWHIHQPMLKLKTYSGFHDLFLKYVCQNPLFQNSMDSVKLVTGLTTHSKNRAT